jgi:hypothetical protein
MLFYISLPSWSNIKLCTMVDRERFSVFRVDHWLLLVTAGVGTAWVSLEATDSLKMLMCDYFWVK